MAKNYVKTFTAKHKGIANVKLPSGSNPGTPQSFALINDDLAFVAHNQGNNNKTAHLRKYTKNGYVKNSDVVNQNLGHCNGACYCNENGLIYATGYAGGSRTNKVVVMNTNFKQLFTLTLPVAVSGIGYDSTNKKFYCSKGEHLYVFPFSSMKKDASKRTYSSFSTSGGTSQDVGGYGGVAYKVMWHSSYGDIDAYKASNGKYLGSIKIAYSETESVDFTSGGKLVYMTANQNRAIHWTNYSPPFGSSNSSSTKSTGTAKQAFLAKAKKQVGTKETGNNNVKYNTWYYGHSVSGNNYAWCAVFIAWCANSALGNNKTIPKNASAHDIVQIMVDKCSGKLVNKNKAQAGDLFNVDYNGNGVADHVGIIYKVSNGKVYTYEGNYSDKVAKNSRSISSLQRVARPNWPDGTFNVDGSVDESAEGETSYSLQVSPEQLYSSANYQYIEAEENSEFATNVKATQDYIKSVLSNTNFNIEDNAAIPDSLPGMSLFSGSSSKKATTRITGNIEGVALPSASNYVEAPFVKLTIGGVSIGTYKNGTYPNYISGLRVKKTNGSLNEYTINLIHQVAPGDNPNYIDNLISANGYNKIKLEYGDAEGGIAYNDINALLTGVKSSFDFFNEQITYTITATSSAVASAVTRRNYSAVTAQPSSVITSMLYDTEELLEYFPGMSNKTVVSYNNLIPSNDIEVELDAKDSITPLEYLNYLVSNMTSNSSSKETGASSVYYLNIVDNDSILGGSYFQIKEIKTQSKALTSQLVYEVNVGYPDQDTNVYNFAVNTNFAWPLAYEYSGSFPMYDYDIDSQGNSVLYKSSANIKTSSNTKSASVQDKNWWTNVTEFPITATLELKGLSASVLLLTYIKVNVLYYGSKRSTSGMYVVTGQEDILSSDGFRTTLDLLRVGGDNQYLTTDGRIIT